MRIYRTTWEMGLKGITFYRQGSTSKRIVGMGPEEEPHGYEHGHGCDPMECRL